MADQEKNIRVGIVGAGAIACGVAVVLETNGHKPTLWSPSGKRASKGISLIAQGAINGTFKPQTATSAKELAEDSDVILFALPVNGHKKTMDAISPYIDQCQQVIISSHASFSALYLAQKLAKRNVEIPIIAWNTTAVTARQPDIDSVNITSLRDKIEIVTIPHHLSEQGLSLCKLLFDSEFEKKDALIEIILSNLNPEVHMGMALCNITRMEQGEDWCQRKNVTPTVGRLIEALDTERLAIAEAYGYKINSILEKYKASSNTQNSLSSINQSLHTNRAIMGPKTIESRYVLEDVPYGLLVMVKLGTLAGVPTPIHEAGITLFSALYGHDFTSENTLLTTLDIDKLTSDKIIFSG